MRRRWQVVVSGQPHCLFAPAKAAAAATKGTSIFHKCASQLSAMAPLAWLLLTAALLCSNSTATAATAAARCRCLPSDSCWPDASTWESLNASMNGQLLNSKPPAFPCYDPEFGKASCDMVMSNWSDAFWRADQVGAMQDSFFEMQGDERCLIGSSRSGTCSQGRVPIYAVRVSKAQHIQKAVKFASKHNLRLVIKNTGHDYLGRSSAAGSLSIWMHNLQDITFDDSFVPQGCSSDRARSGVTIGAGVVWEHLYKAVHDHGKTIAGAQCTSVGAAGGYPQAAGHSQMSPTFGLSADNLLQMQVVTAKGELVVANACQNKDLFWALRGGGGGTFGVVTSVTHATHPPLSSLHFASYFITSTSSSGLESFLTEVAKATPALSDAGWGGFLLVDKHLVICQYLLPNRDASFAKSTFQPLLDAAERLPGVNMTGRMEVFPSYYDWHKAVQCSPSGCSFPTGEPQLLTSRLISRDAFISNPQQVASTLLKIKEQGYERVFVYFTAGGKVATPPAEGNAVNPAWRKALWHVIVAKLFQANQTLSTTKELQSSITATGQLLRDMTAGSGSYLNEADYNEPEWQRCFFGDNYERLLSIKKKVDPDGLFVCRHCVGSEEWNEDLNCRV